MTPAPLHFAGERLLLDPAGLLFWPSAGLLAVADLHFEKGTACAERGRLVPPWDTAATLDRLALALRRWQPRMVIALGDSFHDARGAARLQARDAERLRLITGATRFVWVCGNHDPCGPEGVGGESVGEFAAGPFTFRHIARRGERHEISGHFHPKASVPTRAASVERPCFVTDGNRVVLPAFGAYTGGLDVRNTAFRALFPRGGRVFLLGRERLFSFALATTSSARTVLP